MTSFSHTNSTPLAGSSLAAAIQGLVDRQDITDVMLRFGRGLDLHDWDLYAATLCDSFEVNFFDLTGLQTATTTPEKWARFAASCLQRLTVHHQYSNFSIRLSGDEAEGIFYHVSRQRFPCRSGADDYPVRLVREQLPPDRQRVEDQQPDAQVPVVRWEPDADRPDRSRFHRGGEGCLRRRLTPLARRAQAYPNRRRISAPVRFTDRRLGSRSARARPARHSYAEKQLGSPFSCRRGQPSAAGNLRYAN